MKTFHVGDLQHSGLTIYVLDICHEEWRDQEGAPRFPGTLEGNTLTVTDLELARTYITEGSNSADADGDNELAGALANLSLRIAKASR
jgi:hypothetical protein